MNLIERMEATQKTLDEFRLRPFELGKADCVQMMLAHAKRCGFKKLRVPAYHDWKSAAKTLRTIKAKSISEWMDARFRRIGRSELMMGDFIELPGGNGFTSLMVAVGNGRALGFHEDIEFAEIVEPVMIVGAWSVDV